MRRSPSLVDAAFLLGDVDEGAVSYAKSRTREARSGARRCTHTQAHKRVGAHTRTHSRAGALTLRRTHAQVHKREGAHACRCARVCLCARAWRRASSRQSARFLFGQFARWLSFCQQVSSVSGVSHIFTVFALGTSTKKPFMRLILFLFSS